jgi:hypothetical protein
MEALKAEASTEEMINQSRDDQNLHDVAYGVGYIYPNWPRLRQEYKGCIGGNSYPR